MNYQKCRLLQHVKTLEQKDVRRKKAIGKKKAAVSKEEEKSENSKNVQDVREKVETIFEELM